MRGVEKVEMVEGIRRALEANRAAYEALRAKLRVGMTERDAYELVRTAVDRVCGDESHEFIGDFVGGARSGAIEGPATDYAFRRATRSSSTCRSAAARRGVIRAVRSFSVSRLLHNARPTGR